MIADLRNKIIDNSIALFSQKGFDSVSTTDIAKKSKIAASTLYYHFKDKDDLLRQAFYDVNTKMAAYFRENIDYSKPFEEQFKDALFGAIKYLQKNKYRCFFYSLFTLGPNTPVSVADRMAFLDACPINQLLNKGMESGAFIKRPPTEAMALGYQPIHNYCIQNHIYKYKPLDNEVYNFINSLWKALQ